MIRSERFKSATSFFVLFLFSSLLYFTENQYWWIQQILLQLSLCLIALFLTSWRVPALIFFLISMYGTLPWFIGERKVAKSCHQQIDRLTGQVQHSVKESNGEINLIKVELWCQGEHTVWPVGVLDLETTTKKTVGWYGVGDRISLKRVKIFKDSPFSLRILPKKGFRIYNETKQSKVLRRGEILLYVQSKARYFLQTIPNAFYRALVTADRTDLDKRWRERIQYLGIAHLFAISGMHVGILYLWITAFVRCFMVFPCSWVEKGYGIFISDIISATIIALFLWLIGMPVSAKRALIMLLWWMGSRHLFPWQPLWVVLPGAAILILSQDPTAIGQLSFQLSFLSVAGILAVLPLLPQLQQKESLYRKVGKLLLAPIIISVWLFLVTFPLISKIQPYHSALAILTNVIHIFYMSWIYLPIAVLILALTILGYPFFGFPGEFYLYSLLNLLGKTWEWMLQTNAQWSEGEYSRIDLDFPMEWMVLYWIVLFLSIPTIQFLGRAIKKKWKAAR